MTIISVMVVEVLVFVPSVSKFRADFLRQRIAAAQIAALSLTEAPNGSVSEELGRTLLSTAGVEGVVLDLGDRAELILQGEMPSEILDRYTVDGAGSFQLIGDAYETARRGGQGLVEVRGKPVDQVGISISIVLDEADLFDAMTTYGKNIFWLSLVISLSTGALIYAFLYAIIVRPVWRLTRSMDRFREDPENPGHIHAPKTHRRDEMGMMERELAAMQGDVHKALGERRRLAALGEAVSKINHDLRNLLAAAQLSSDSLRRVDDPKVQRISKRMITAIDRAIALCERTLKYGRAEESAPDKAELDLHVLVTEVGTSLTQGYKVQWHNQVSRDFRLLADQEQLFRMLLNLGRNAAQALQDREGARITVSADAAEDGTGLIRLADNGPGLPEKAKENLFVAFKGSVQVGGTGLGLAIVAELMQAHGGSVDLEKSDETGATFRLTFAPGSAHMQPAARKAG